MYKLAIFDMDGTILDTLGDLTDATNFVLKKYGFPPKTINEIRIFVGNGIEVLLKRALDLTDDTPPLLATKEQEKAIHRDVMDRLYKLKTTMLEALELKDKAEQLIDNNFDEVIADFKEYYGKNCANKTKKYPGITELLKKLHENNIKTAVISNKPDSLVKELCQIYFPNLFDYPVGNTDGTPTKPDPTAINNLLKDIGLKKCDAVFIGDSDVDIETGRNAKLDTIGVSWGFKGKEFLIGYGTKCIVDNTDELFDMINNGCNH